MRWPFAVALLVSPVVGLVVTPPLQQQNSHRRQRPVTKMVYSDVDPETGKPLFRWNLNAGRQPWGIATNGEVWNGRVAMISFVWIVLQELITGDGVITVWQQSKPLEDMIFPIANIALFVIGIIALTVKIATEPDDSLTVEFGLKQLAEVDDIVDGSAFKKK